MGRIEVSECHLEQNTFVKYEQQVQLMENHYMYFLNVQQILP